VKPNVGKILLGVRDLSDGGALKSATFDVRSGEILGVFGLMGSGRTEALRCIAGLSHIERGDIRVPEDGSSRRSSRNVSVGLSYLPEDRHAAGIVPTMSAGHNISLSWIRTSSAQGVLRLDAERRLVNQTIGQLNVRPPLPDRLIRYFSGGNQQKVVLGKCLATQPRILLLDEPTRGVDVGAKAEIHNLIAELKSRGVAIVMVSSELPEILNVADRIVVMHEGRSVAELPHGAGEQEVMLHAFGQAAKTNGSGQASVGKWSQ
jgi:ribose transport system ATP-binding protein